MKNLQLLGLLLLFASKNIIAQEASNPSKWSIGASITMFESRVVDDATYFDFFNGDHSGFDLSYSLNTTYSISPHFFLEAGVGFSRMERANKRHIVKTYTESNSLINTDDLLINSYQFLVKDGLKEVAIEAIVASKKIGDDFDLEEGDDMAFRFTDDYIYDYLQVPFTVNYKLSKKRLSLVVGLGPRINIATRSPEINTRFRQAEDMLTVDPGHRYIVDYVEHRYDRNTIQSLDISTKDLTKSVFWDAALKLGLIHQAPRNTFFLDVLYHRSIGHYSSTSNLEQLGISAGWKFNLGPAKKRPTQPSHAGLNNNSLLISQ